MPRNIIATLQAGNGYDESESRGRNYGGDKEMTGAVSAVTLAIGYPAGLPEMRETVVARVYTGRSASASVVYVTVWIRTECGRYISGTGKAGGGGYHKASAALAAALDACGVTLSEAIDGRGDGAFRDAIKAVALAARPESSAVYLATHGIV